MRDADSKIEFVGVALFPCGEADAVTEFEIVQLCEAVDSFVGVFADSEGVASVVRLSETDELAEMDFVEDTEVVLLNDF